MTIIWGSYNLKGRSGRLIKRLLGGIGRAGLLGRVGCLPRRDRQDRWAGERGMRKEMACDVSWWRLHPLQTCGTLPYSETRTAS